MNIVILATGGTIAGVSGSAVDTTSYQSGIVPIDQMLQGVGPLEGIAAITSEQIAQVDSSDMNHDLWLLLARKVNGLLRQADVDGVVITHGTDTLEETAYFLNLVVKSEKPVVLVGAMRPATALSSDGPLNLYNAVVLAASPEARGKGVLVALNNAINSSRDVTKTNTVLQDTFKAPELGYLGYLIDNQPSFYRAPTRRHTAASGFDVADVGEFPQVDILYGHVDDNGNLARAAVRDGAKGLVYAGVGNGNMSEKMEKVLQELQTQGVVIVRSTRVSNGIVTRNGAINDDANRFVAADTLSPQKARILLMLALLETCDPLKIQKMFWEY
ncbi:L-asparaginase [Anaerosporomusa subterranea]|uniref:asparaginase n=1 Tax=Anaerosporomusa subterranea TaxID=1794912 RepID=A0A154BPK9_ANASB|nr:asparaginase [Anaerosporomusa subterranea]KYZ75887.1 L-asparaginase [Anaerosporomusa subterranea]